MVTEIDTNSLDKMIVALAPEEVKFVKKCLEKYIDIYELSGEHTMFHQIVLKLLLAESELVERRKEDISKRGV